MPISGVLGFELSARVLLGLQPVLRDQFEKLDPDLHLSETPDPHQSYRWGSAMLVAE
jgi:hypothetical protein